MVRSVPFEIIYPSTMREDLQHMNSKWHREIQETIEEQLRHTPLLPTRNRKELRKPIATARWELRCGPDNRVRVLYNCDVSERVVRIVAIGEKLNNELWIRGEKVTS